MAKLVRIECKWHEWLEWLQISVIGWKRQEKREMAGDDWKGQEWLEMAGHGRKWL